MTYLRKTVRHSDGIPKPSIVQVLRYLAPGIHLADEVSGWRPVKCPFHPDKSASASYNTDIQRFKCHGCGVSGDGYDLVQEVERCDFQAARRRIATIQGITFSGSEEWTGSGGRSKLTDRKTKSRQKLIRRKYQK